jgi:hypothetical protein
MLGRAALAFAGETSTYTGGSPSSLPSTQEMILLVFGIILVVALFLTILSRRASGNSTKTALLFAAAAILSLPFVTSMVTARGMCIDYVGMTRVRAIIQCLVPYVFDKNNSLHWWTYLSLAAGSPLWVVGVIRQRRVQV